MSTSTHDRTSRHDCPVKESDLLASWQRVKGGFFDEFALEREGGSRSFSAWLRYRLEMFGTRPLSNCTITISNPAGHLTQLACAALLFFGPAPAHAASPAPAGRVILSTEQGAHQVLAPHGRLVLIAATLADTQTYKRTLSFYFSDNVGTDLLHVPVIESKVDHTLTLQSISRGEETISDAALAVRGEKVYLIQVTRNRSDRGAVARWFQFSEAGDDNPDGPAYVFKPVAQHELKQPASIEAALQAELKRKL